MPTYGYPAAAELQEIEQEKLPILTANDPIFTIMPMVQADAHLCEWEQEDNWTGLQQVRGLGGQPGRVNKVGAKRYSMEPGVYGEYSTIDEVELTTRRKYGTFDQPADISDLVMREQDRLLMRRLDRIRYIGWTLVATGTFAVSNEKGVIHTDTFSLQTYAAGVAWATVATAKPIQDFRAVKLQARGKGVSFGGQAKAYVNQVTANNMLNNTNAVDIGGKLVTNGNHMTSLADVNKVLLANDLPQIEVYDDGYLDDTNTFQPWIPNAKVVLAGFRPGGARIADYAMTRNASNPNMAPGAYTKVDDDENRVPRSVRVHDGHNGGPRIYFPSALVVMSV
jgi:hypothetical protein